MKASILALLLVLSCQLVYSSRAHALDLFGYGSYWEVEDAEGTWGAGLGVAIPLFNDYLRFESRIYLFDSAEFDSNDELDLYPLDFGLQLHILPDQDIDPYILAGASWIYADADRADVDSEFGAYIGGGVDFGLGDSLKLFGEAVYRMAELDSDSIRNDEVEISGVTGNVGLKFTF